jgi:uncharacterized membrane protein
MSLIKDLTTGLVGILFIIFIAPLPVTLVAKEIFGTSGTAIIAHIIFIIAFYIFREQTGRKFQQVSSKEITQQFISVLIRMYCLFFVTMALLLGAAQGVYMVGILPPTMLFVGGGIAVIGFFVFAKFFFELADRPLTPLQSSEHIRGTQVKSGDDLPDYLPPPPGGIGE